MSNMGYCLFENTIPDLEDCAEALKENGSDLSALGEFEQKMAKQLIALCAKIAADYGSAK